MTLRLLPSLLVQMLGILRSMRLAWPSVVQNITMYVDQTQTVTSW